MADIQRYKKKKSPDGYGYRIRQNFKDDTGKRIQKIITCKSYEEALKIKPEVEKAEEEKRIYSKIEPAVYHSNRMKSIFLKEMTVKELLEKFVDYRCKKGFKGRKKQEKGWDASTLASKIGIINNYILPEMGEKKVASINTAYLQDWYNDLPFQESYRQPRNGEKKYVSNKTIGEIDKILSPAFSYAVKLGIISVSPVTEVLEVPCHEYEPRVQWTKNQYQYAVAHCKDRKVRMVMCLMYAGTLRSCELEGFMWDCVHIPKNCSPTNPPYIEVKRELMRIRKEELMRTSTGEKVYLTIPDTKPNTKTSVVVLEKLKTDSSKRRVYLPFSFAEELINERKIQISLKKQFGEHYTDYGFVIALDDGKPFNNSTLNVRFKKAISSLSIPQVTPYSLRGCGASEKSKYTSIQIVQSETGHADVQTLTQFYLRPDNKEKIKTAQSLDKEIFSELSMIKEYENNEWSNTEIDLLNL